MGRIAYALLTAVLAMLAVARVGRWALAEPTPTSIGVVSAAAPASPTTIPAFLSGPVVTFRSVAVAATAPTTTTVVVAGRAWTWDALAGCESHQRWDAVRGVYQGGLQFDARTWDHYAPAFGYPADAQLATRAQQIAVAEVVLAQQGPRAWPTCGPRVGLTGSPSATTTLPAAGPPDPIDDDLGG